jgi:hypothetical protein
MSLLRRVSFLCSLAVLAVGSASAQSAPSSSSFSSSLFAAGESSSHESQFALDEGIGRSSALPGAPAAGGSGGGTAQQGHGWKSKVSRDFALELGAGFNSPIGNDKPFITWGGNLTVGGGLHFSKRLSLLAEYQLIDDKLPAAFVAAGGGTAGNAHIWSFTLDPVLDILPKRTNSVYLTGGGGFYRKVTSFTVEACCDFYGYLVPELANHFSSNQGGVNLGIGFTHRLGGVYGDGTTKLFAEARYLDVKTPEFNAFTGPTRMGQTELIPVNFGLRW